MSRCCACRSRSWWRCWPSIEGISDLALTTNGLLLADHAAALRAAGLDRLTVSVPSLDPRVFAEISGLGHRVEDVLRGIDAAERAGFSPIKINVVVIKGTNDGEVAAIARYFKERGHVVRFIEYMDVGTLNHWEPESVVSSREILERIGRELPLEPAGRARASDVADRFRYLDDGVELGTIASVTEPFCGDCARGRITAEGQLYTCLFAAAGHDLKGPLRAGADDRELEAHRRRHLARPLRSLLRGAGRGAGGRADRAGAQGRDVPDRRVGTI